MAMLILQANASDFLTDEDFDKMRNVDEDEASACSCLPCALPPLQAGPMAEFRRISSSLGCMS